jgi:drug/metabolite transporter (DMT)-like permease
MIDPKLMALVTAISFGIAPVLLKVAFRRGGAMTVGMVIGQVLTLLLNVALIPFIDPGLALLTPVAIIAFVAGGLAGTAIGRRWTFESVDLLGPARSTTIRSASPVITTLLAIVLLREDVSLARWLAILAVVGGAMLVSWTPGAGARGWIGRGVMYAFLAAAIYGVRPLIVKVGLEEANVPLAAALIGATAALIYTVIFENRASLRVVRFDAAFRWFALSGLFQATGITALTFGLANGRASLVYSLTASAPLFTLHCVAPGPIYGDRMDKIIRGKAETKGISYEQVFNDYLSEQAIKRFTSAVDIAYACLYLASDEARQVTGQCLTVDGGWDV